MPPHPPEHESPYPAREVEAEGRLVRVETTLGHLEHDVNEFRGEVKEAFSAVNTRLIGFAFVVAGSAVAVALTVVVSR